MLCVVEIFHVLKSQQSHGSEIWNCWITFLRFLKCHCKKRKKIAKTYSRTMVAASRDHRWSP